MHLPAADPLLVLPTAKQTANRPLGCDDKPDRLLLSRPVLVPSAAMSGHSHNTHRSTPNKGRGAVPFSNSPSGNSNIPRPVLEPTPPTETGSSFSASRQKQSKRDEVRHDIPLPHYPRCDIYLENLRSAYKVANLQPRPSERSSKMISPRRSTLQAEPATREKLLPELSLP